MTEHAPLALPPRHRSRVALGLTRVAARGLFELPHCLECGKAHYPPQETCGHCLSHRLAWRTHPPAGVLLARADLHHAIEPAFQQRAPLRTGLVRLTGGVTLVAFIHRDCRVGDAVTASFRLDRSGAAVPVATPPGIHFSEDPALTHFAIMPADRTVLITDASGEIGRAFAHACAAAGAAHLWLGVPGAKEPPTLDRGAPLSLPVDDAAGLAAAAALVPAPDIIVNTWRFRAAAEADRDQVRSQMKTNCHDLMALWAAFGPQLRARGGSWVDLLAIEAIAADPDAPGYSASMAAANAVVRSMRAEAAVHGARVVAVYPGPLAHAANADRPGPKIGAAQLAERTLAALHEGVEDVFPDAIARDIADRAAADPKALEREIAELGGRRAFAGGSDLAPVAAGR
ncbi:MULTISPECIES: SDR family NAD(P)-dependent oxidoreductase [unclassified Roseitalea]|uniref:SDR family NAD(P)-dependent oxidoreductase n=1 Tax=unclassified Roseitalea TaxID=2639107 RepID=UPI00273F3FCE|nr:MULTISPECIES: SDR family NAD(P)-dependent oxidoreductase [unclassified Roseitalea]